MVTFSNCSRGSWSLKAAYVCGILAIAIFARAGEATLKAGDELFYADLGQTTAGIDQAEKIDKAMSDPLTKPEDRAKLEAQNRALAEMATINADKYPNSDKMNVAAGALALRLGDAKAGLARAERAVALTEGKNDPESLATALRLRGAAAYESGDFKKAEEDAARVLKMFPADRPATLLHQASVGRRSPVKGAPAPSAFRAADMISSVNPLDDPRVKAAGRRATDRMAALRRLDETMRLLSVGDARGALNSAQFAQAADPAIGDIYMQKALAWSVLKDLAAALTEVTKAIGLWTAQGQTANLPAAYSLRASLKNGLKDHAGAAADAGDALAYDPALASAYYQRGRAREALGEKGDIILADLKRAAELKPAAYRGAYEEATDRLSGAGDAPAPAASVAGGLNKAVGAAAALLVVALVAGAFWFARGRRPARRANGDRKTLSTQYDLEEQIGEGGMGAVYRGYDKTLKRPVAVKRLRRELQSNARERERFLKEAELVASLHHPHIVDIYNIIRDDEDTYLVFEYIVGKTLHELLGQSPGRRFTPSLALDILDKTAQAVDHAHSRHVIHRDLKPANVMVADGGWVKVMDFGIARQVQDSMLTTTNTIVGTPNYMAPEQAMGAVVKQSDVYGLGVTLYEMLTGALPFRGVNEMHAKLEGEFAPPSVLVPDLGTGLDAVLRRALAPRAEDRYPTCVQLHAAAARALGEPATPA